MKKVSNILLTVFSYGVLACLFAGGIAIVAYTVALLIGGDLAEVICAFTYQKYFPWVIRICAVCVGLGLIGMYLGKQKALTAK